MQLGFPLCFLGLKQAPAQDDSNQCQTLPLSIASGKASLAIGSKLTSPREGSTSSACLKNEGLIKQNPADLNTEFLNIYFLLIPAGLEQEGALLRLFWFGGSLQIGFH